jgi:hypothetical protein
MSMMDKRVVFNYIPHCYLNINDTPIHFVGERNMHFTETIIEGDPQSGKFIIYYVYGEEVIGFCTVGYRNIHLYLWEAMKQLVMPPAQRIRSKEVQSRQIIQNILRIKHEIHCKRPILTKYDRVQRTELDYEF